MSSLPASIKKIRSKTTEKRWRHRFSHNKSMGAFCCHGNQSFDLICPKTLCSLSPTPVILHIKFDLGWPAGFRDIQVLKCGQRRRRGTDDGPLLYYKLTLWAFGSGELKTCFKLRLMPNSSSTHRFRDQALLKASDSCGTKAPGSLPISPSPSGWWLQEFWGK